ARRHNLRVGIGAVQPADQRPARARRLARHSAGVHHEQVRLACRPDDFMPRLPELPRQHLNLALIQAAAGKIQIHFHSAGSLSSNSSGTGPVIVRSSNATTTGLLRSILLPAASATPPCPKSASRNTVTGSDVVHSPVSGCHMLYAFSPARHSAIGSPFTKKRNSSPSATMRIVFASCPVRIASDIFHVLMSRNTPFSRLTSE